MVIVIYYIILPLLGWISPIIPTLRFNNIGHVSVAKHNFREIPPWPSKKHGTTPCYFSSQEHEPCVFLRRIPMLCCHRPTSIRRRMQMASLHNPQLIKLPYIFLNLTNMSLYFLWNHPIETFIFKMQFSKERFESDFKIVNQTHFYLN